MKKNDSNYLRAWADLKDPGLIFLKAVETAARKHGLNLPEGVLLAQEAHCCSLATYFNSCSMATGLSAQELLKSEQFQAATHSLASDLPRSFEEFVFQGLNTYKKEFE